MGKLLLLLAVLVCFMGAALVTDGGGLIWLAGIVAAVLVVVRSWRKSALQKRKP